MKQPPRLRKGDTIALIAPSFGCTIEPYKTRLKAAIANLTSCGYKVREGKNIYLSNGEVSSNTPEERAEEFMDAYQSEAKAIISVGGGELMNEILPYIDFEKIRKLPPKWFMGFSDNTNLTFTLTTLSDVMTVYGINAPSFCTVPFSKDARDALRMLSGSYTFRGYAKYQKDSLVSEEEPLAKLNLTEKKVIVPYNYKEPVYGMILGGCLDCLSTLCGTEYDKVKQFVSRQKDGIIFYLEACDLNPLSIRRALFQLRDAGWFTNVRMFLIGRPRCQDMEILGMDKYKAVKGVLGDLNVPILMDVDLGHLPMSLPMKNGGKAYVSYNGSNIFIHYGKKC